MNFYLLLLSADMVYIYIIFFILEEKIAKKTNLSIFTYITIYESETK